LADLYPGVNSHFFILIVAMHDDIDRQIRRLPEVLVQSTDKGEKNMKTTRKVLIFLLLVGVVAAIALLLVGVAVGTAVGAAGGSQELLMDLVVSNVDDHPPIDAIVEKIPDDCQECHNDQRYR
jgi:hypothetical protein